MKARLLQFAVLILFAILLILIVQNWQKNHLAEVDSINKKTVIDDKNQRVYTLGNALLNKRISSIQTILGNSIYQANDDLVVFVYSGFDCRTCIEKGFKITHNIDSAYSKQIVRIIVSNANIAIEQLNNNYMNFIFNDEHDLIRKELKFLYTPIFLHLDKKRQIKDFYYPMYAGDEEYCSKFLKSIMPQPLVTLTK